MQTRSVAQSPSPEQLAPAPQSPGTQTFRFAAPPPEERQMKSEPAFFWQKSASSVTSEEAATSSGSQLRKQCVPPSDVNGEHTCRRSVLHSPSAAQQSSSDSHVCVQ